MFSSTPITAGTTIPRYRVALEINGGAISAPVVAAAVSYMIVRSPAQMPTAEVTVPTGLEMGTNKWINAVAILANVTRNDLARIIYYPEGADDGVVLFDGRVTGVSFLRTDGSYGVTVSLVHWLADLEGCAAYFPSFDATFPAAAYRSLGLGKADATKTAKAVELSITTFAAGVKTGSDPWKNFTGAIAAAFDLANGEATIGGSASGFYKANRGILDTLARISSGGTKFNTAGAAAARGGAMRGQLAAIAVSTPDSRETMLDKVLVYCRSMNLMLIPCNMAAYAVPEGSFAKAKAIVVPFNEQSMMRLTSARNRVLRGCVMIGVGGRGSGNVRTESDNAAIAAFATGAKTGMMVSVPAPFWLSGATLAYSGLNTTEGVDLFFSRSRGSANAHNAPKADDSSALQAAANAWCKMYWAAQMTSGSMTSVEGPARFDIGPGTQLICEGPEDQRVHGMVEGVRIVMDAERCAVSTEYAISGSRSEAEQEAYGMETPALYEKFMKSCAIA